MDRHGAAYRSPSPSHPTHHGYQLEENPYGRQPSNLDMPMAPPQRFGSPGDPQRYGSPMDHNRLGTPSDHLALNAPVSVRTAQKIQGVIH